MTRLTSDSLPDGVTSRLKRFLGVSGSDTLGERRLGLGDRLNNSSAGRSATRNNRSSIGIRFRADPFLSPSEPLAERRRSALPRPGGDLRAPSGGGGGDADGRRLTGEALPDDDLRLGLAVRRWLSGRRALCGDWLARSLLGGDWLAWSLLGGDWLAWSLLGGDWLGARRLGGESSNRRSFFGGDWLTRRTTRRSSGLYVGSFLTRGLGLGDRLLEPKQNQYQMKNGIE